MLNYAHGENFLSYARLGVVFPSRGLVHVTGPNGSGKSALLSFLKWVWFDVTDRGGVDSVINAVVGKNCFGEVSATCHGHRIAVRHYRKHKEHKNARKLFIDDVEQEVDQDHIQARIDQELGFDKETFLRAFVFDQSMRLALMKDVEAKAFFERVIGVDFTSWHDAAKELQVEMAKQAAVVDDMFAKKTWQHERDLAELVRLESEYEAYKQTYGERLDTAERAYNAASVALSDAVGKMRFVEATAEKARGYSDEKRQLAQQIASLEQQLATVERMRESTEYATANIPDRCPTCGQVWPKHLADNAHEQERLARKAWEETVNKYDAEAQHLVSQIVSLKSKQQYFTSVSTDVAHDYTMSLASARTNAQLATEEKGRTQGVLDALKKETTNYPERIAQAQQAVRNSEQELETLAATSKSWSGYLDCLRLVVEMYSKTGLQSYVLDKVLPFINARLAHYLFRVTGGDIEAEYRTTTDKGRERFHLAVEVDRGGDTYESLSEGQAARVNICLILALHDYIKLFIPTKLLVFDDLFDKIDIEGIDSVASILQEIAQETLVIAISHNSALSQYADKTLQVTTKDKVSQIS